MQFTMGSGGIPAGTYPNSEFLGAESYRENLERYGEGVILRFRVLDGEHAGEETSRICSAKMSPKSALGKFAVALAGRAIAPGDSFDFARYIGTRGSLMVEATESGGTRVSLFLRQQQSPVATPMPQDSQPAAPAERF